MIGEESDAEVGMRLIGNKSALLSIGRAYRLVALTLEISFALLLAQLRQVIPQDSIFKGEVGVLQCHKAAPCLHPPDAQLQGEDDRLSPSAPCGMQSASRIFGTAVLSSSAASAKPQFLAVAYLWVRREGSGDIGAGRRKNVTDKRKLVLQRVQERL